MYKGRQEKGSLDDSDKIRWCALGMDCAVGTILVAMGPSSQASTVPNMYTYVVEGSLLQVVMRASRIDTWAGRIASPVCFQASRARPRQMPSQ